MAQKANISVHDQPKLLNQLIESIGQAEGACSQLIYQMDRDPRWLVIRESLELAKEGVTQLATFQVSQISKAKK